MYTYIALTFPLQKGKTPLQLAKEKNKYETVKFLESYLQEVHS